MANKVFYDQWGNRPPVETFEYSECEPVWIPEQTKSGEWILVQHGETNVYNSIQSHTDETDLRAILAKCAATGDYSALHQRNAVFGDISGIPNNLTDAQNRLLLAKQCYNTLDPELKAAFGSFENYASQIVKGEFSSDVMEVFDARAQAAAAAAVPVQVNDE